MITKISEEDLLFFQTLSHPINCGEILFHDFDSLGSWDKEKFGKIRVYQYPMIAFDSLFLEDPKLSMQENFNIKNGMAESYNLGGRLTGKTAISIIIDGLVAIFNKTFKWGVISAYDKLHVQEAFEKMITSLENHPIMRMLNAHILRSPTYKITADNGCLLESVNMNIMGKAPGAQFFGKHIDKHWMEESSFITQSVSNKLLMAQSELGCINRFSGMTTFSKHAPMGKIFLDLKNNTRITNLPSYVNPTWNSKKEEDSILEFGGKECFDDKTEILTDSGWKNIDTIALTDRTVSWDVDGSGISEYAPINNIFKHEYDGKLYGYNTQHVNFLVTNNHKLPLKTLKKKYRLISLQTILDNKPIKESYILDSTETCLQCGKKLDKSYLKKQKYFCSVGCKNKYTSRYIYYPVKELHLKQNMAWSGQEIKNIKVGKRYFDTDTFLIFLGWFVSEGCVCEIKEKRGLFEWTHWRIQISQTKSIEYIAEIKNTLHSLGLNDHYSCGNFVITDKVLAKYLLENCGKYAINKKVPEFLRHLSCRQINIFLDAFNKGDGDGKRTEYYTTSSRLSNELQELIIKSGGYASICIAKKASDKTNILYLISERTKVRESSLYTDKIIPENYRGKIWCVETNPYHTVYIRRDGKCSWSGNSIGYKVQIEGKVVEDSDSVYDIERIRESYNKKVDIKTFEITKDNFFRFKEILVMEKLVNSDFGYLCSDIGEGAAPTEIIIIFKVKDKYKYTYNITATRLSGDEQYSLFKFVIDLIKPNVVGLDTTSGMGKALASRLTKDYPENIIWVSFNEKIRIDFEKDDKGNFVIDSKGQYQYKEEYITDWSIQRLKHLFYNNKMECLTDYKLDVQFGGIVATRSGLRTVYASKTANHLHQAFQVFSIVEWQAEFSTLKPTHRRKLSMGVFGNH
jgi:hypothetical protein